MLENMRLAKPKSYEDRKNFDTFSWALSSMSLADEASATPSPAPSQGRSAISECAAPIMDRDE
jgi:hypothetical protein